ncbi:MAG: hypothetical protein ABIR08_09035 [Sphingomonas sp.]
MILALALFLLGCGSLWLGIKAFQDFRRHDGVFSEEIVSDATPLNRRLWRANAWIRLVVLMIGGATCLVGAFELTLGK